MQHFGRPIEAVLCHLRSYDNVTEVVLAHPGKTRLMADAQIKTGPLDARGLAHLLRGDLVATAHIPSKANERLSACQ